MAVCWAASRRLPTHCMAHCSACQQVIMTQGHVWHAWHAAARQLPFSAQPRLWWRHIATPGGDIPQHSIKRPAACTIMTDCLQGRAQETQAQGGLAPTTQSHAPYLQQPQLLRVRTHGTQRPAHCCWTPARSLQSSASAPPPPPESSSTQAAHSSQAHQHHSSIHLQDDPTPINGPWQQHVRLSTLRQHPEAAP